MYGNACTAYPTVKKFCRQFKNGKEGTKSWPRPGGLCTASTEIKITRVDGLIGENYRISIRAFLENVDVSV